MPIATFRYKPGSIGAEVYGSTTRYRGTIAQELLGTPFESAVRYGEGGVMFVNYSKLDVPFVAEPVEP